MQFKAQTTVHNSSLEIGGDGIEWRISIRRTDGQSGNLFGKYNDQHIAQAEIEIFVPDWDTLQWTENRESTFSHSESYLKGLTYKINVAASRGSKLTHQQVQNEFKKYMRAR